MQGKAQKNAKKEKGLSTRTGTEKAEEEEATPAY
jgi:hypothetical protein